MIKLLSHAKFSIPDTERQTHGAQCVVYRNFSYFASVFLNSSDYFFKIDSSKLENKNNTRRYIPAIFSTIMFHQGHSYMFMNGQKCNNEFGNTEEFRRNMNDLRHQ